MHQFDELARDLARGVSRRQALRRFGEGLVAAALAFLGLKGAWGQGNCDAAHFCQHLPPGQRGQCVRDAAHGSGLYAACQGDSDRLCPMPGGAFTCCSTANACCDGTCCDADQVCRPAPTGGQPVINRVCCEVTCTNNVEQFEFCCPPGLTKCCPGFGCVEPDQSCPGICNPPCAPGEFCLAAPTGGGPITNYICCTPELACSNNVEREPFCCSPGAQCCPGFGCIHATQQCP